MRRSTKDVNETAARRRTYRTFTSTGSHKRVRRSGRSAHVFLFFLVLPIMLMLSVIAGERDVAELIVRLVPRTSKELRRRFTINWKLHTEQLHLQNKFKLASSSDLYVHIISLSRAGERTNLTAKSCRFQGVKFKMFNAVDGLGSLNETDISIFAGRKKRRRMDVTKYFEQDRLFALYKSFDAPRSHKSFDGPRSLQNSWHTSLHERLRFGCYMSHISLWRELLLDNVPFFIILEDDVIIENEFLSSLRAQINNLPATWGLLYLNGCFRHFGPKWDSGLWVSQGGLCTYGYVISRSAADYFLSSAAMDSDKPLDHMMDEEVLSGRITAFHAEPPLVNLVSGLKSTLNYVT